jgi:hypothetical protein
MTDPLTKAKAEGLRMAARECERESNRWGNPDRWAVLHDMSVHLTKAADALERGE